MLDIEIAYKYWLLDTESLTQRNYINHRPKLLSLVFATKLLFIGVNLTKKPLHSVQHFKMLPFGRSWKIKSIEPKPLNIHTCNVFPAQSIATLAYHQGSLKYLMERITSSQLREIRNRPHNHTKLPAHILPPRKVNLVTVTKKNINNILMKIFTILSILKYSIRNTPQILASSMDPTIVKWTTELFKLHNLSKMKNKNFKRLYEYAETENL